MSWNRFRQQTFAGAMKVVRGMTRAVALVVVEKSMPDDQYAAAEELLDRIGAWHQPNRLEAQIVNGPGFGGTKDAIIAAAIVLRSLD